ncbi:MAG: zinc-binding dehydrogenase [Colwellia sp.]
MHAWCFCRASSSRCKNGDAVPDDIPSTEAVGLLTAHATAHRALRQRSNLTAGETLLVTGAVGGTCLAAIQIAKAIGAKVIAVCSSEDKLAIAKENGADILINSGDGEVKSATEGKGVDVAYDCVGGELFNVCSIVGIFWRTFT